MKITVITGSARKNGGSARLADEFINGASENGHEVYRFNSHFKDVHFCIGCNHCNMGMDNPSVPCVFKDDFAELRENLLSSDIVVFATPLYYFGFSAQIKRVIDRFYSINTQLTNKKMKAVLLSSQHDTGEYTVKSLQKHYSAILEWLNMDNIGTVNATGISNGSDLDNTDYLKQAYNLGKSI